MSDHCLIPLNGGKRGFALISPEDADRVGQFNWTRDSNDYVCRTESYWVDGKRYRRKIMLHRFILDAPADRMVDHRHGDRLDNRRGQIRLATRSENAANSGPRKGEYKGVSWCQADRKWRAIIKVRNCKLHLGMFTTAEQAAKRYDLAALEAWPEHAYLNFPHLRPLYQLTLSLAALWATRPRVVCLSQ